MIFLPKDKKWDKTMHSGVPDWLSLMVHHRAAARAAFTSDYDTVTAPYKTAIDQLARRRQISMLKATGEFITLQKNMNASSFNELDEKMAHAAGLDLAEAQEGLE